MYHVLITSHPYINFHVNVYPYIPIYPILAPSPQDVQPKKASKAQGVTDLNAIWMIFLLHFRWKTAGFPLKAAAKPKAVNEKPSSSKAPKDEVPKDYLPERLLVLLSNLLTSQIHTPEVLTAKV